MDASPLNQESAQTTLSERDRSRLIVQIVSALLNDSSAPRRKAEPEVLNMLIRAMRSGDTQLMSMLNAEIRRHRISPGVVVDVYVPEAAASVGAMWHDEQMDILAATITFARMQALLRSAAQNWHADDVAGTRGAILMLSPDSDQHTLGALVATSQFRRLGVSVTVCLSVSERRALAEAMAQSYDAICISIGNKSSLESAAKLVKALKRLSKRCPPIIIGGSVPVDMATVVARTGADLATRDAAEAIRFMKLEAVVFDK